MHEFHVLQTIVLWMLTYRFSSRSAAIHTLRDFAYVPVFWVRKLNNSLAVFVRSYDALFSVSTTGFRLHNRNFKRDKLNDCFVRQPVFDPLFIDYVGWDRSNALMRKVVRETKIMLSEIFVIWMVLLCDHFLRWCQEVDFWILLFGTPQTHFHVSGRVI